MVASVIIPCWKVAEWMEGSLRSVLTALPPDSEVIAIDDGSPDNTGEILSRLADEDNRIKVLTQPNRGVSAARNHGLDVAKGEYVFFVDPDDTIESDFFSAMIEAVKSDQADYCVCAFNGSSLKAEYRFDNADDIRNGFLKRIFGYSYDDIRAWYLGVPLFSSREMAFVWRGVFRRDIIERYHIRFDEAIALNEDSLFLAEYLLNANRMTSLNRALYNPRNREDGAMSRLNRDAAFVCENKLRLLRKRNELNASSHGLLTDLYAGTCVLSALDMFALTLRGRLSRRDGWRLLRQYLKDETVQRALTNFPLSLRKPIVALAVTLLRHI